ncbi:hypothetical protein DFA_07397 [Cavenderia fasciculata]|uniref:Uncharacterized protein n=1 Tax=Cavenderia fasciculata TaxID=261658 RepID=F4PWB0_CACFS|nr:uncharacterized protein DFA_07397 [Cavenderia fasciculata]EGG20274.1 hypothetical protein DFA_07397 [Cavenderia fasciculata]|eukprot:XP_004367257.1 hypothetical protein DFA_07397 [Cavenderia fasciculata]
MHSLIIIIFILSIFVSFVVSHDNNHYGVVYNASSSSSSLFSSFNHVELQSISINNDNYVCNNTLSFNHVEHQPIPIISIAHKNKSFSFVHALSINNSSDIIVSQCQSQPLPLPLLSNYSTTNNLILLEEREMTVQLNRNCTSNNTISNTCLDNNPIISFPSMSYDIIIQYNSSDIVVLPFPSQSPLILNHSIKDEEEEEEEEEEKFIQFPSMNQSSILFYPLTSISLSNNNDEHPFNISIIYYNIININNNNNESVSLLRSLYMYIPFNSSDVSTYCQSSPLLLNHSTTNHFLLAEEEESIQLNNNTSSLFSLFNHVEHQSTILF